VPGFIVTRGLGPGATPSAMIARGLVYTVVEVIKNVIRKVGNGARRLTDLIPEIFRVRAMLLAVNNEEIVTPASKLLITEVYDDHEATVTISDIETTTVKSSPYRIVISDVKVRKGD
tara:strand:+ start:2676 stop:3026 length:351 start_codon:yes stop_codon:yes gene_type:complete